MQNLTYLLLQNTETTFVVIDINVDGKNILI
jgi:hypothetical protein